MGLFALFRRKPHERAGFELYGTAVAAARQPWFFATLGVPDTLDGRFDLVGLHVALLIRRLHRDPDRRGPALAQAVFDAMFADMDLNLREMGVGDLVVGKRVKRMWEAFHGRAQAYEAAIAAGDAAAMAAALRRNVWRAEDAGPPPAAALALAGYALAAAAALEGQGMPALLAGEAHFPPAGAVADAA
ncbi:ubiquinol-cytochrome C chaperone family protein [Siccirubricoccus phaeus]|uniref:ubiquinol-cytochrome C chaperone family protein n=1 Tax=Siccirubricoccus phaeus TaxID=2595053 RepID=UPI0011F1CA37|nr:ubiquinol-cytochrome C chaperone family protein [Siccirubricoccus phaeus]